MNEQFLNQGHVPRFYGCDPCTILLGGRSTKGRAWYMGARHGIFVLRNRFWCNLWETKNTIAKYSIFNILNELCIVVYVLHEAS